MDSLGAFDIQLKVQLSKTCVFNSTKHGVYVDGTAASIKSTPINTCIGTGSAKLAVRLSSYNPAVPLFGKFGGFLWSSSDPTDVTFSPSTATTTVDSTDSVVTVKIAAGSTTKSFDASVLIVNSSGCSTIVTKSAFLHLGTKAIIKAPKVGCTGVPVSFTDISQYGPDTFSWSVAPDPTKNVATAKASVDSPNSKNCHITFTDTGFFVITHKIDKGGPLSGLGASGCYKDTTDTIHIQHPRAYFSSPNQQSGCAPQIVSFDSIAPTKNIAMYYWNYGDKTSDSTLDTNWFHIYALNNPNGFTVSMAVKDSQGCIDTFKRLSFIHLNGPVPGFTISAHSACGDSTMTITNTSINITDLTLDFRDGSAAQTGNFTTITHKYTYTDYSKDSLKYYPLMIASDNSAATCYATYTDSITLYRPPSARISSSSATTGCAPYTVNFQDVSLYNDSTFNRWDFDGDGIIDASNNHANPSFTYNTPGTYTVRLFVSTGHCTDSVTQVNMITIYGRPTADFTVDNDTACPSNLFTLSATDKNPWNSVITGYNWDFGDTTSSNVGDSVPTHTYKYGGGHDVQLIVTNSDGCSDTTLKTGFIYTYPTVIPDSPLILSVSVDLNAQSSNTGAVIVKWSKDVSGNFSKFDLFRSDMAAPIDPGITDPNIDTFYDQTTDVYDLSYGYALDKSDKCGFTSFKGPAHYTMVLRATPNPIGTVPYIDLTWSNYVGWKDIVSSSGVAGPIAYQVWRKDNNNIYYSLVTTLFATTTTAADTFVRDSNNICNGVYRYYIVAVHPTDSSLNSNSNRDSAAPNYTFQTKQLNLLSTTVINDTMTFTKWTGVMQPNVKAFIIDRQDTSGRWVIGYDSVGPNQDSFYDTKARVNSTSYHYRVKVLDKCGNLTDGTNPNEAGPSNLGTSMYFGAGVVGNCPNEQFSFLWTPYDSFKAGRDRYILQIKDNAGNWRDYKNLDAKIDSAGDDSIHLDINGPACYRIVAYSSSDPDNSYNQNQSISNSKCLLNCSRLYFPDAFTPNGDGLNDSFAVTSVAVFNGIDPRDLQYSFKIFNRWGELVWSTNDLHAKWGGQFGDDKSGKAYQDCPVDVYVYQVEAHGMDKQIFFKKGVVTIIR